MEEEENSRISCLKSGENRKTKKISARGTDSQDMNSIRGLKKELLHSSVVCKFLLVEHDAMYSFLLQASKCMSIRVGLSSHCIHYLYILGPNLGPFRLSLPYLPFPQSFFYTVLTFPWLPSTLFLSLY